MKKEKTFEKEFERFLKKNQGKILYLIGSEIAKKEIKKLKKKLKIRGKTTWEKWMSAPVQKQYKNNK